MTDIQISLQEVADTSARLRSLNSSMYDALQTMKQEMNGLEGTWISDGSAEIRSRFNMFANRFEQQKETIEAYADFLDRTVSAYETLESTITTNASDIQY